jgi:hypothetical protein
VPNYGKKLNKDYPSGFYIDPPRSADAPDWVVGSVGINVADFQDWIETVGPGTDRLNFDICKKQDGSGWYVKLNTWTPEKKKVKSDADLPF